MFWMPTWKGGCQCGWVDGFHVSKLAVLPLVLVVTWAIYRVEVTRIPCAHLASALWCGAITWAVITIFLWVCFLWQGVYLMYLPAWFAYRAWGQGSAKPKADQWMTTPFWAAAGFWAHSVYTKLPDTQPTLDCFVVTAAARGHRRLVGPFTVIEHNGHPREANAQLIALWRFEEHWRKHSPRSHAAFRMIYNRIGPLVAARITSPWIADLVYFALKPVQWIAQGISVTDRS